MAETKDLTLETTGVSSVIELDIDDPQVLIIMKALASETRLNILRILKKKLDVCQTAKALNQTEANVSAQIKILEKAHLISPKYEAGRHGVKKICGVSIDRIIINI
ncbi:MAG: ArsR/SmtB family transcription factor [Candidatus Helarchaeota archaeon]